MRVDDPAFLSAPHTGHTAKANWQAELRLGFADDDSTTRLTERMHSGPLRVQKPLYPEGREVCHAIVVHPPGGVVGGDELSIAAHVGQHAHALVTTPGAAKWYRANGKVSQQRVLIDVAPGATLEWLPQETIFFNHADVELRQEVSLAVDAGYIGCDVLCFGRRACGESFDSGQVRQRTSIRRGGKLVWHEQGLLGKSIMASPLGMGGHTVCATLIAIGPIGQTVPAAALQEIRTQSDEIVAGHGKTGATLLKQLCVVRYSGHSSEVARQVMVNAWRILRPILLGRAAVTPRIWNT